MRAHTFAATRKRQCFLVRKGWLPGAVFFCAMFFVCARTLCQLDVVVPPRPRILSQNTRKLSDMGNPHAKSSDMEAHMESQRYGNPHENSAIWEIHMKFSPYGGNHSTIHHARQVIHDCSSAKPQTYPVSYWHLPRANTVSREWQTSAVSDDRIP